MAATTRRPVVGWATFVTCAALASAVACQYGGTDDVTHNADPGVGPSGGSGVLGDSGLEGLCGRAGGTAAVKAITTDALQRVAADCRIGAYFANLKDADKQHLSECMTIYLGETFTCPGVTYAGSKDSAGAPCRAMGDAHKNLGITNDDEKAFQDSFVGALHDTGKLVPTDVGNVITHMSGERGVFNANNQGNPKCSCNPDTQCVAVPPPPPPQDGGAKDTGAPVDSGSDSTVIADTGPG